MKKLLLTLVFLVSLFVLSIDNSYAGESPERFMLVAINTAKDIAFGRDKNFLEKAIMQIPTEEWEKDACVYKYDSEEKKFPLTFCIQIGANPGIKGSTIFEQYCDKNTHYCIDTSIASYVSESPHILKAILSVIENSCNFLPSKKELKELKIKKQKNKAEQTNTHHVLNNEIWHKYQSQRDDLGCDNIYTYTKPVKVRSLILRTAGTKIKSIQDGDRK